jgi:mono/diheme cytochrome c family protein
MEEAAMARTGDRTTCGALAIALALGGGCTAAAAEPPAELPPRLSGTGLYAEPEAHAVAPDVLPYAPQYPLWTDGAAKRRWIRLPPGASIDATDPAGWSFPAGTRFWKEFAFGRPVETRFMEKQSDGSWRFASYVWDADGRDATLAPPRGIPGVVETRTGARHDVPGVSDCRACHLGRPGGVLGFDALQLSPDRDPLALHQDPVPEGGVDLPGLSARGLLRGLPQELVDRPPRIPARTPRERAALGYLVGNCSSCHGSRGPLTSLGMSFEHDLAASSAPGEPALRTALGRTGTFAMPGEARPAVRIAAGEPGRSAVVARLSSRDAAVQMPPMGTHVVDEAAVELVAGWIRQDLATWTEAQAVTSAKN